MSTVARGRHAVLRRVARNVPRPSDRILPSLLEIAATFGSGPSLIPPAPRRVLVVVPHPDDEAIGAGGLLALLAARGATIDALLVSDGEATIGSGLAAREVGRRRRAEFLRSIAHLGVRPYATLGLPDGAVTRERDALVGHVHDALVECVPELVLAPWPLEAHPDHRATADATAEAMRVADWTGGTATRPELWTYEAHTPIPQPSHVIDVTDHVTAKRAALDEHVTAAGAFDLTACLALARWRSLATRAGRGSAEAFLALEPSVVLDLAMERAA